MKLTQEHFNQCIEDAMRQDFGREPSQEEKIAWCEKILAACQSMEISLKAKEV